MAKEPKKHYKQEPEKPKKDEPEKKVQVSTLTPEDLAHFRVLLIEKRSELIGNVSSMESEALKKSRLDAAGDLSSMPIHMADIGTDNYEQEFALGLLDGERKMLHDINEALSRIDEGTYGICEGTGDLIPRARLEANPWAKYSVAYQTLIEKGLVEEPELDEDRPSKKKAKRKKRQEEEDEIETEEEEVEEEEVEEEEAADDDDEDEDEEDVVETEGHQSLDVLEEDEEEPDEQKYF
ncbi:MAG: hypothetical protein A2178_02770 [Planctomycetes bacterium GWC2_49_10]|nr:MAG: hypothetical protein A2178_02770 [Planctomycetes bacterium GWC2_49_10]